MVDLVDFIRLCMGTISSLQNCCKLVPTAQIKFPYRSYCSVVSFLYILGLLEVIWTEFFIPEFLPLRNITPVQIASNDPRMYKNDTTE